MVDNNSNTDEEEQSPMSTTRSVTMTRSPSALEKHVQSCLTLTDPTLLRTMHVEDLLRGFAWVLGSSDCGEEHYKLSRPADRANEFISHNWSTPRADKFLSLALHYNFVPAMLFAAAAAIITFVLEFQGILPCIHKEFFNFRSTGWIQVIGVVALSLGLCFHGDLAAALNCRSGPRLFLDRTCVCQTDAELKRRGIANLAAILYRSDTLVVLYTDVYLKKLWTVYEITMYLLIHPRGRLVFQPVVFAEVVLSCIFIVTVNRACFAIYNGPWVQDRLLHHMKLDPELVSDQLWWFVTIPLCSIMTVALRKWAGEHAALDTGLRDFSIRHANCLSAEDRDLIEQNIAIYAKHACVVGLEATREEALTAFDALINRQIRRIFLKRVGRRGIPYRYAVTMFSIYAFYALDAVAALEPDKVSLRTVAVLIGYTSSVAFAIGPLAVALNLQLSMCLITYPPRRANFLVGLCTFVVYNGMLSVTWHYGCRAPYSDFHFSGLMISSVLLILATAYAYRPTGDELDPPCKCILGEDGLRGRFASRTNLEADPDSDGSLDSDNLQELVGHWGSSSSSSSSSSP